MDMTLEQEKAIMLEYLRLKLHRGDMHGVQDAASDIREIDAKIEERQKVGLQAAAKWLGEARARQRAKDRRGRA